MFQELSNNNKKGIDNRSEKVKKIMVLSRKPNTFSTKGFLETEQIKCRRQKYHKGVQGNFQIWKP
jgi:hypothetical protein